MGLESGTYISDLVATNPLGTDPKSDGDGHLRLIKSVLLATFPNVNGAISATDEELSMMDGSTDAVTVTAESGIAWAGYARKVTSKFIQICGQVTNSSGGAKGAGGATSWASFPGTAAAVDFYIPAIIFEDTNITAVFVKMVQSGGNITICPFTWKSGSGYGVSVANGGRVMFNTLVPLA